MSKESETSQENVLLDTILKEGETGTDVYCIVPKIGGDRDQPISTGVYNIKWKRLKRHSQNNISILKARNLLIDY